MKQIKVDFRGGAREGAGRKSIGTAKQIKLTLPDETWAWMEARIQDGQASSRSEFIRNIIQDKKENEK